MPEKIKLTEYSKGAGCGCKIAPDVLESILQGSTSIKIDELLVGNETRDDAAVYDLGNGKAVVSTTDFFMPIVNEAYDFGRIAAANALSDVYAMGGKPLFAIAILGWPVEKLPSELAREVLDGARKICEQAGIALAGGHSIDSAEPIFGLSVTGEVQIEHIKRNSGSRTGDIIYLSKAIGVGMVTTAHKRGLAADEDFAEALDLMTELNLIGGELGKMQGVTSMTDVTGFGLLGHLIEMCEASALSCEISYDAIPKLSNLSHYALKMIYPDITFRNWKSYGDKVEGIGNESLLTLCDPQTSGGLLFTVDPAAEYEIISRMSHWNLSRIGEVKDKMEKIIYLR